MNMTPTSQAPDRVHSVILRLGDRFCSLPVDCVREMTVLPEVRKLCGTQPHVPGVITLRGEAIPVVDLRMRLGMEDQADETAGLVAELEAHRAEHEAWLAELAACLQGERAPRKLHEHDGCRLARWIAELEPASRELGVLVQGLAAPLMALHAAGREVADLLEHDDIAGAKRRFEALSASERRAFQDQLERVRAQLDEPPRRIVTVIRVGTEQVGLIVDEVASLAWVRTEDADISREAHALDRLFASMGRSEADAQMVSMLDPGALRVHAA